MAIAHIAFILADALVVDRRKTPPVDLGHLEIVLFHVFLGKVVHRIHVAGMAGDEQDLFGPVLQHFPQDVIQVVFQDLPGHGERAGERSQGRRFTGFDSRCNQGVRLFRHQFGNPFGHQQIGPHGQMRAIHFTGSRGDDHQGILLHSFQILFPRHFSDIILHDFFTPHK